MSKSREVEAEVFWRETYNDLALARFREENFVQTTIPELPINSGCSITHLCKRGSGDSCDVFGCNCYKNAPNCGFVSTLDFASTNAMTLVQQSLLDISANSQLYVLRNNLSLTIRGDVYVRGFYELSSHFHQTLNVDIVTNIGSLSGELKNVIYRYLNGTNEVLFNDAFYLSVANICKKSTQNSQSNEYKVTMDKMLSELSSYKNLTVTQVKTRLNQPF